MNVYVALSASKMQAYAEHTITCRIPEFKENALLLRTARDSSSLHENKNLLDIWTYQRLSKSY